MTVKVVIKLTLGVAILTYVAATWGLNVLTVIGGLLIGNVITLIVLKKGGR